MPFRALLLLGIAAFTLTLDAAPRRRAIGKPVVDLTTPAGWLSHYARPLTTTEFVPYSYDLEPLRAMIDDAVVVGLGDGTHGTHEFFTLKLRTIDFLVREMGFDVVAFEGPFALLNRINTYVQGGNGNARSLVGQMTETSGYTFWDTEEIVELVEWMRVYNRDRGGRPAIEIAGADVFDELALPSIVIQYLHSVDSAAAEDAAKKYSCTQPICAKTNPKLVYDSLAAREAELVPRSSFRAYHDALQSARIIVQRTNLMERDPAMAANIEWARTHRGTSGKVIYWAHNEHVTKGESPWTGGVTAGHLLRQSLGDDYFTIGTLTAAGAFTQWALQQGAVVPVATPIPAPRPDSYESFFRQRGALALLVPLRGDLPAWLAGPAFYNTATTTGGVPGLTASLPSKFDAVMFVDTTTPLKLLP